MKTILKYPGGKEKELPIIKERMPKYTGRYVEPFVGGGAVFFDTGNLNCCINDKSEELINLYDCIKNKDNDLKKQLKKEEAVFFELSDFVDNNKETILYLYYKELSIEDFIKHFNFAEMVDVHKDMFLKELKKNLTSKIKRSHTLEEKQGNIPEQDRIDNIECALKSAYYMYIRYLYNHSNELSKGERAATFYFVREFCYSSMFRFNTKGEFNVPYGGISYNRKDFSKKVDYALSSMVQKKLANAIISCDDFENFLDSLKLTKNDFIFLDPPYDTDFSTYDKNEFGKNEQIRLCKYLKKTPAKIMLVIKNTDFIYGLYKEDFNITDFNKNYIVSFMNRNDKNVKHLVITNY